MNTCFKLEPLDLCVATAGTMRDMDLQSGVLGNLIAPGVQETQYELLFRRRDLLTRQAESTTAGRTLLLSTMENVPLVQQTQN